MWEQKYSHPCVSSEDYSLCSFLGILALASSRNFSHTCTDLSSAEDSGGPFADPGALLSVLPQHFGLPGLPLPNVVSSFREMAGSVLSFPSLHCSLETASAVGAIVIGLSFSVSLLLGITVLHCCPATENHHIISCPVFPLFRIPCTLS